LNENSVSKFLSAATQESISNMTRLTFPFPLKITVFTLLLITFAVFARAEPATKASVEELLAVMKMEKTQADQAENLINMIRQGMAQAFKDKQLNAKQRHLMEEGGAAMFKISTEEASWGKTKPIFVKSYQENFSQEEVVAIIDFYRTPAGNALIDKQPVVQQEILKSLMPKMAATSEKVRAYMVDLGAKVNAAR
jgi:hypothetical protein